MTKSQIQIQSLKDKRKYIKCSQHTDCFKISLYMYTEKAFVGDHFPQGEMVTQTI